MASNFSFQPFGLSQMVTVTAGTATVSLTLVSPGNVTASLTSGGYVPTGIRIVNLGAAVPFLQFGNSTVTVGPSTGMALLGSSRETFKIAGFTHMAHCNATTTLCITLGEGR